MSRKLVIDGNAVYEIDEDCMLKKRIDPGKKESKSSGNQRNTDNCDRNSKA